MGRGSLKHLHHLAKKKPSIAKYLSMVDELSESDIDALSDVQSWIKKQLKHQKRINIAMRDAANMPKSFAGDPFYDVFKYNGSNREIGEKLLLEIERGDMIVAIGTNNIKVNSMVVLVSPQQYVEILGDSMLVGNMQLSEYNREVLQPYLCEKHGFSVDGHDPEDYMSRVKFF